MLKDGSLDEIGVDKNRLLEIEKLLENWVKAGETHTILSLVAHNGVIFHHKAYGRMEKEAKSPKTKVNSIFALVSISKTFTAVAVMRLYEKGKIDLKSPVCEYIPEFSKHGKEKILVRHVLNHSSGMRDGDTNKIADNQWGKVDLPPLEESMVRLDQEGLQFIYETKPDSAPDKVFIYNSYMYVVLGELVRRVSGKSFDDFTRSQIFKPLGMKDTYFALPQALHDRVADRVGAKEGFPLADGLSHPGPPCCAFSTTYDMGIFGQMLLQNGMHGSKQFLKPETIALMKNDNSGHLPKAEGTPPLINYGYGLFNTNYLWEKSPESISNKVFGNTGGSGSILWVDPENQMVGIFWFPEHEKIRPWEIFISKITSLFD
ncbi:MAG: beta-lactamase family protein [Chloroflexi bacterium]|nr:beta-lactamase family protein [Chloroflexota bacterium]